MAAFMGLFGNTAEQLGANPAVSQMQAERISQLNAFIDQINSLLISARAVDQAEQRFNIATNIVRWGREQLSWWQKIYDFFAVSRIDYLDDKVLDTVSRIMEQLQQIMMVLDVSVVVGPPPAAADPAYDNAVRDAIQQRLNSGAYVTIQNCIDTILKISGEYLIMDMGYTPDAVWGSASAVAPQTVIDEFNAAKDHPNISPQQLRRLFPIYMMLEDVFMVEHQKREAGAARSVIASLNHMKNYEEIPFPTRMGIIVEILADQEFAQGLNSHRVLEMIRNYQFNTRLSRSTDMNGNPVDNWAKAVQNPELKSGVEVLTLMRDLDHTCQAITCPQTGTPIILPGAFNADQLMTMVDLNGTQCRPANDVLLYFSAWCKMARTKDGRITEVNEERRMAHLKKKFLAVIATAVYPQNARKSHGYGGPGIIVLFQNNRVEEGIQALGRLVRMLSYGCPESMQEGNLFHRGYMRLIFEHVFPVLQERPELLGLGGDGGDGGGGGKKEDDASSDEDYDEEEDFFEGQASQDSIPEGGGGGGGGGGAGGQHKRKRNEGKDGDTGSDGSSSDIGDIDGGRRRRKKTRRKRKRKRKKTRRKRKRKKTRRKSKRRRKKRTRRKK